MGDTMRESAQDGQPPRRRPFQFGLKHLLAAPVWLALLFAAHFYLGALGAIVFLILSLAVIGIWVRAFMWLGVVATLLLVAWLLLHSYGPDRSLRAWCGNRLKQIALALHKYHDDHGRFPPAYISDENGRPIHSWRVLILPYLGEKALYDRYRFDEPWDGPNNGKLHNIALELFNCPEQSEQASTTTNYLVVIGPHTLWKGADETSLFMITDDPSETLLVVEVADSGIHWMEPRDLHVVQMARGVNPKAGQGISSGHPGGAHVAFADGRVSFLGEDARHEIMRGLLTIEGDETIDWDRLYPLKKYPPTRKPRADD